MKKGLSLLLAASVAASAFSSAAMAAELTAQEKFEALVEAEIFTGFEDGSAQLDESMTRAQVAAVIQRLLGLEEDAAEANEAFTDLEGAGWAAGYIGAVNPEIMQGNGDGTFGPSAELTYEQLAAIIVRALKIEVEANAEVEGTVSDWAKEEGVVAAAVKAGILPAQSDYTAVAPREALVEASYSAAVQLEVIEEDVEFGAKAVGAKKIEVSFGAAVDASKVTVAVKKGSIQANVKEVKFAEDNKSAVVELATNLTKGDYTVTVTGATAEALTATVTAEDEKVSKIEFTSDKAPLSRTDASIITAGIKVSNQYGEDITNNTALTLTAGVQVQNPVSKSNGTITIDSASNFTLDQKVALSAVHAASGTFATTVLTVSPAAKVANVEITKLAHADNKTPVAGAAEQFNLVIKAQDQYGNAMTNVADIADDVIVSVSNPSVANIARANNADANSNGAFAKPGDDVILPLINPIGNAGTSTVFIISKTTGNKATFDVTVAETPKVDTLTLSAPELAVGGEKVKIPFTAIDQFGKEMTKDTDIEGGLTSAITSSFGDIDFKQDYVTNKAYLELDLSTEAAVADGTTQTAFITAVTKTGKIAQLSVTIQPNAKAAVISATKDFTTNFAVGATAEFKPGNVKVADQYGRDYTLTLGNTASTYRVLVKTSDAGKVALGGSSVTIGSDTVYALDNAADIVNFSAAAKGSSTITLELQTGTGTAIANSTYTFATRVVEKADIASYEVEDIPTLYASATADYHKAVKVNGVLTGDAKVVLPSSYYTVTSEVYGGGVLNGSLATGLGNTTDSTTEVTRSVIVTVNAANVAPIVKEVKISDVAPAIATLSLKDDSGTTKKEGDGVISADKANIDTQADLTAVANAIVKAVDQYGVTVSAGFTEANVIVTNLPSGKTLATVAQGETFNVTAITNNSKVISFKVIVK